MMERGGQTGRREGCGLAVLDGRDGVCVGLGW